MSVDVTNETEWIIDPKVFSEQGVWVNDKMRVSTQSDLAIMFVDPEPIATLHERWMNLQGPTDVMCFPMRPVRPVRRNARPGRQRSMRGRTARNERGRDQ